ncbi:MAG: NAD(P)-binding protein [Deltaproteobacteria bacterium]|nr:NAD(P)-binding protein [Deltaproteobacteria bacterium]
MPRRAQVVGGGVAGLVAAWRLAQSGWRVELCERQPHPGGLLAQRRVDGVPCDLGAHRLHPAALRVPALAALAEHVPMSARPRTGRIVLRGRHLAYPPSPWDLARGLGPVQGARFALGFALAPRWRVADGGEDDLGFAAFVRARVGEAAYNAFYAPYARKVWGLDPAELSQTCAKQRVSAAAPWRLVQQPVSRPGFLVPVGGFNALVAALIARCERAGVELRYGCAAAPSTDADGVVYSGHLGDLAPDLDLGHRGLHLLWLAVHGPPLDDVDTWYCPEQEFAFGRVTQVAHFTDRPLDPPLLCVEIPQGGGAPDQPWHTRLDVLATQLSAARILPCGARVELRDRAWLPRVYPLHRRGWRDRWQLALRRTTADGRTVPVGRQGLWLHCNLDHAMHTADEAARWLAVGGDPRHWPERALSFIGLQVRD